MLHPKAVVRTKGSEYCGDSVDGDYREGPTRLSLIDTSEGKLLNTVKIIGPDFDGHPKDSFHLPFFVSNDYYHVPHIKSTHEGKPQLLHLIDLTGDGVPAEFVLFVYGACGIASTGAFGYNQTTDRAVQYSIEVHTRHEKPEVEFWMDQIFATKPIRPGCWDFTWSPGHGMDDVIHERVSFDSARQMFIDRQSVTKAKSK